MYVHVAMRKTNDPSASAPSRGPPIDLRCARLSRERPPLPPYRRGLFLFFFFLYFARHALARHTLYNMYRRWPRPPTWARGRRRPLARMGRGDLTYTYTYGTYARTYARIRGGARALRRIASRAGPRQAVKAGGERIRAFPRQRRGGLWRPAVV